MFEATEKFPSLGIEGIQQLVDFYRQYDIETNEIRKNRGFYCLQGCGACCYVPSSKIEVSVFELIPLSIQIAIDGKGDEVLQLLETKNIEEQPCIFYKKNSEDGKQGFCSEYAFRPLICRLFGGGARIKKDATREMLLCKLLKDEHRLNQKMLDQISYEFPLNSDTSSIVRNLNLTFDSILYPINIAMKKALEYVMFRMQWYNPDAPEPDEPPVLTPEGGMDHAA